VIELLEESEQKRQRECASQAAAAFHDSVLAIYASNKEETGNRPEHVGSGILLDIDGTPVISTAAHIITDARSQRATLFIADRFDRSWYRSSAATLK
jgi:hypothetical protein